MSSSGIYKAEVSVDTINLKLSSLVMLSSSSNCYEFSEEEYSNSSDIAQVDEFLKTSYGMSGSVMELFQIQMKEGSKRYRVIYTNKENRKL